MKYKCLVFDHDDTVVNSTASIHYPSFAEYVALRYPGRKCCTLEEYFISNFDPGFIEMCRRDYGMSDADLNDELEFWRAFVDRHIPEAYAGIRKIMEHHKAQGGIIAVVSHSLKENILRDYEANGLPEPDAVYGWELPPEQRKPHTYPLDSIMERFSLKSSEMLVIDDLKPGYDMAKAAGVDFAAAGWSNDIIQIKNFMQANCDNYFGSVAELAAYLA